MDNFRDSYFQINWDLSKKRLNNSVWGKQYDTGRGLAITLISNGVVVTPSTEIIRLKWEKQDGTAGYVNSTVVSGKFILENIDQMFTVAGMVKADLELQIAGEFVASVTFFVTVDKAIAVGAIQSSNEFTALQEVLVAAENFEAGYAPRLAEVSAQLNEKATQDFAVSINAKVSEIVANASDTNGNSELIAARINSQGNAAVSLPNRVDNIENQMSANEYTYIPKWVAGYISGTDGTEGTNTTNAKTQIIHFKQGDSFTRVNPVCSILIHTYNSGGVWQSYKGFSAYTSTDKYTFTTDTYLKFVFQYSPSATITDFTNMNAYITFKFISKYQRLSTLETKVADLEVNGDELKIGVFGSKVVIQPVWEFGYINGSTGAKVDNTITARTKHILTMPKGSTLQVNNANVTIALMKYVNGVWNTLIVNWTMAKGIYTFPELTYIKLNYNYTGNPTITDLNLPNSYTIITKFTLLDSVNEAVNNYWGGKKIAWFGTSIPAGDGNLLRYPNKIGNMLGCTMYNESEGSSGVRAGHYGFVSGPDAMGYSGVYFEPLMKSLSLSSIEKQAIFDAWSTWQPLIPMAPVTIPDVPAQTAYKACSWDIKLAKYLTGGSVGKVDLYVFDHGHNDAGVGYNYDALNTVPSDPIDRKYFIGAMNFIIGKILADNPKARICFIGHYENARKAGISIAQQALADIWDFPFAKTWEKMGFSQKSITSGGTTKTITQWWMPDDLHPHSDTTGKAIQLYTDTLYPFIRDVR